jgi:putative transposase
MSHTYTYLASHLIFSTKDRLPMLTAEIRPRLWAYMSGVINNIGGKALAINGMPDHAHLLVLLPPSVATAEAVRTLKANSSKWLNDQDPTRRKFAWQSGYAAFSVSRSAIDDVERYIETQEEHHKKLTYQEELIVLLRRHNIEYDERYIWK